MNELRLPAFGMEEFGLDSLGCLEGADEGRAAVSDGAQVRGGAEGAAGGPGVWGRGRGEGRSI